MTLNGRVQPSGPTSGFADSRHSRICCRVMAAGNGMRRASVKNTLRLGGGRELQLPQKTALHAVLRFCNRERAFAGPPAPGLDSAKRRGVP